jgi:hypothetical protein
VCFGKGVVRLVWLGDSHDFGLLPACRVVSECEAVVEDGYEVVFGGVPSFLQEAPANTGGPRGAFVGSSLEEWL